MQQYYQGYNPQKQTYGYGGVNYYAPSQDQADKFKFLENYKNQLQDFGNDYKKAKEFAEKQQQVLGSISGRGIGSGNQGFFANEFRRLNQDYFKKNPYDYSSGNFQDWMSYQNLMNPSAAADPRQRAQLLANYQKNVAGDRATRFAESLPQYIEGETSSLRSALQDRAQQSRKALLADMNRRGILRSGQRGLGEARMAADFGSQYEKGRADIYAQAQQKAQELFTNPLLQNSGYQSQLQGVQSQLQNLKDQQNQQRSQFFGAGMGLIGSGIGTGLGNMQDNKTFFGRSLTPSTPTTAHSGFNTIPGTMRS